MYCRILFSDIVISLFRELIDLLDEVGCILHPGLGNLLFLFKRSLLILVNLSPNGNPISPRVRHLRIGERGGVLGLHECHLTVNG